MILLLCFRVGYHSAAVFAFSFGLISEKLNAISTFRTFDFKDISRFEIIRILSWAFVHHTPHLNYSVFHICITGVSG